MILGNPGKSKTPQTKCKKGRAKMEAQSQKIRGLNLNPLAPAQSKRTFAFSGKNIKIQRKWIHFSSLFHSFFETFRETSKKGSRVWPQGHKNTSKWTSRTPKRSPRINNLRPKVPPSTNSRGRVLAEGDVDPAAGSPKEPFRL